MEKISRNHNEIVEKLNYSGDQNSYFDFWHLHYDFDGNGNNSLDERIKYIKEGIRLYDILAEKLKVYPKNYQLWIGIDEIESGDDGIYIHTPNPNNEYFPHLVEDNKISKPTNIALYDYIKQLDFEVITSKNDDTNYYYLYRNNVGVSLTL